MRVRFVSVAKLMKQVSQRHMNSTKKVKIVSIIIFYKCNFQIFMADFRIIIQWRFSGLQTVFWDNIYRRFNERLRSAVGSSVESLRTPENAEPSSSVQKLRTLENDESSLLRNVGKCYPRRLSSSVENLRTLKNAERSIRRNVVGKCYPRRLSSSVDNVRTLENAERSIRRNVGKCYPRRLSSSVHNLRTLENAERSIRRNDVIREDSVHQQIT